MLFEECKWGGSGGGDFVWIGDAGGGSGDYIRS